MTKLERIHALEVEVCRMKAAAEVADRDFKRIWDRLHEWGQGGLPVERNLEMRLAALEKAPATNLGKPVQQIGQALEPPCYVPPGLALGQRGQALQQNIPPGYAEWERRQQERAAQQQHGPFCRCAACIVTGSEAQAIAFRSVLEKRKAEDEQRHSLGSAAS